jgi:hypothetical protein
LDFKRPARCRKQRTGREDRRSKFYEVSDNLSEGDRDAVLAEGALASDRARAGEAKLPAFGAKLDLVVLGALDGGADSLGARSQRPDPSRFEIGEAALVGRRRYEAGNSLVQRL